jgi:hypothetical protein
LRFRLYAPDIHLVSDFQLEGVRCGITFTRRVELVHHLNIAEILLQIHSFVRPDTSASNLIVIGEAESATAHLNALQRCYGIAYRTAIFPATVFADNRPTLLLNARQYVPACWMGTSKLSFFTFPLLYSTQRARNHG